MGISLEKLLIEIVAYYNVVMGSTDFIAGILNITNLLKLQIRRWYPNPGKNTDITFFKDRSILNRCLQYMHFQVMPDSCFLLEIYAFLKANFFMR